MPKKSTLDTKLDGPRLETLNREVLDLMSDGKWRTLEEIKASIGRGSEAGISARLRELNTKYGHPHEKRRRGHVYRGLWEYRIYVRMEQSELWFCGEKVGDMT